MLNKLILRKVVINHQQFMEQIYKKNQFLTIRLRSTTNFLTINYR